MADDDIRHDDLEFDPEAVAREEPKSSKAWLNLLQESEDAFQYWNEKCDNIDKKYANLERLARGNRKREFSMFWANCEVLKPAIYAQPPIPVVVPKFKDRRPVYQAASEVAERCAVVAFDLAEIDELMKLVRDDLAMIDRGVAWCRYESGKGKGYYTHEKVCIDFKNRRDFLHSISRNWREVTWVAGASYLTRSQARERFFKHSGNEYNNAEYRVDKDAKEVGGADDRERAKFWEIWDKNERRVIWVAHGCDKILDEDDPHLDLRGYFPCPKPAFGTVQRGSLVPVPDVLQYEDQLDEIDQLTARIHALADALRVKGFYPSGGAEISEAIQNAMAVENDAILTVPIANWAAFGGTKEVLIWLPITDIATTITALVALRKQIIEDVYQVMGLSDIMRGATEAQETLGAQQLKSQYGSTRIRDKQQELVRIARDLVEITLEIITENFSEVTMIEMSQTQLPTKEMKAQGLQVLQQQGMQLMQQAQQTGQPPDQDQMMVLQAEMKKLQDRPTTDQVFKFLKDNRAREFTLDIETDSTILVDEQGEKQRRNEFVQALGGLLPQLGTMIQNEPKLAPVAAEIVKFATGAYRAGRPLDAAMDEMSEIMKAKGDQPKGDDPETAKGKLDIQLEQMKQATIQQKNAAEIQIKQQELAMKDAHEQARIRSEALIAAGNLNAKTGDEQNKQMVQAQKAQENRESHQAHMAENAQKMAIDRQKADAALRAQAMKAMQPPPQGRPV